MLQVLIPWTRVTAALFVAVALLLPSVPADAARVQWFVEVLTDPISKRPILEVRVLNRQGFRFHLTRGDDNSIWGHFRLPRSLRDDLARGILPVYWIDEHDKNDLNSLKELEVGSRPTLYRRDGKGIDFIMWGAPTPGFIPPVLRQMMLGENLFISYKTFAGNSGTAEIPLTRANDAIAQFLGVNRLDKTNDMAEQASTFEVIARHYLALCDDIRFSGNDAAFAECRDRFVTCSETPDQDANSFKECLGYRLD